MLHPRHHGLAMPLSPLFFASRFGVGGLEAKPSKYSGVMAFGVRFRDVMGHPPA
jgi:hypothetical protein